MQKNLLMSVMTKNGENQSDLARFLGISLSRLNAKINETSGAQFTQNEISAIKIHYGLTAVEVDEIFFTVKVS